MTTTMTNLYPHVPVPAGAQDDGTWEDDEPQPHRVYGVPRGVVGHELTLQTSALQYADGSINTTDDPPRVSLDIQRGRRAHQRPGPRFGCVIYRSR